MYNDCVMATLQLSYDGQGIIMEREGDNPRVKVGTLDELDSCTYAYLRCALWASTDEGKGDGDNPPPMDDTYSVQDFTPEARFEAFKVCREFRQQNARELERSGLGDESVGHDLWLTRNHHGAGFWDRDLGEVGELLTTAAHGLGERSVYGHDGVVDFDIA